MASAEGETNVFVDRRAPQGQKLFIKDLEHFKTAVNATNLGFAVSPLARRGQQVIANNSARRLYPQTKTPLTKLLT